MSKKKIPKKSEISDFGGEGEGGRVRAAKISDFLKKKFEKKI